MAGSFDQLQISLGQGPGADALRQSHPVLVPDLAAAAPSRWPVLLPTTATPPAGAVFCFPLGCGAAHFGTLTLLNTKPGPLTNHQANNALDLACALTILLLETGTHDSGPTAPRSASWPSAVWWQPVVHQAAGMLSEHLSQPPAAVLRHLCATALRENRPVDALARDIVTRQLLPHAATGSLGTPSHLMGHKPLPRADQRTGSRPWPGRAPSRLP
ncbi:hypothetical protein SMD11_6917 [Streptomyces albireticuli]|uniref:ANTAR domain-containing protein n=1 Tax=Streptomyces albireticuli TaxID=1940 RepID=A0A1Z2LDW7_9ACTN|nr:hypothetical protein SMD11_6917 [Streptomyces albireticuli]